MVAVQPIHSLPYLLLPCKCFLHSKHMTLKIEILDSEYFPKASDWVTMKYEDLIKAVLARQTHLQQFVDTLADSQQGFCQTCWQPTVVFVSECHCDCHLLADEGNHRLPKCLTKSLLTISYIVCPRIVAKIERCAYVRKHFSDSSDNERNMCVQYA